MEFITPAQAREIVSQSDVRKEQIKDSMNFSITTNAQKGLKWAAFPDGLSAPELEWLKSELIIAGFTVEGTTVRW